MIPRTADDLKLLTPVGELPYFKAQKDWGLQCIWVTVPDDRLVLEVIGDDWRLFLAWLEVLLASVDVRVSEVMELSILGGAHLQPDAVEGSGHAVRLLITSNESERRSGDTHHTVYEVMSDDYAWDAVDV